MKITEEEYSMLVKENLPKVSLKKTTPSAFIIGGTICLIGEIVRLILVLKLKLNNEDSSCWVSIFLITVTAILTGTGHFQKIAKIGGAGTFIPITGFANAVISSALEFKTEGFVVGVSSKMFIIAGPVIVFGVVSSILVGGLQQLLLALGG